MSNHKVRFGPPLSSVAVVSLDGVKQSLRLHVSESNLCVQDIDPAAALLVLHQRLGIQPSKTLFQNF